MKIIPKISTLAPSLAALLILSVTAAQASVDFDRQYALETIGFLRATDNVDGLFADYVEGAYKDYFSRQSRFVVQDLSKTDSTLSHSKIPYAKLIQDPDVLGQVARTTHSQSVIRTKVIKEGNQYRFDLEWLHAPKMNPLATETMILTEPRNGLSLGIGDVQAQIEAVLDRMLKKIPWFGHVTGRDNQSVTLNIGGHAGLHKGDTLIISSLDDVKRHPLLNTIVDWKLTRVGAVELDSVDDAIAFGHVTEEEENRRIARYQKITQIIPLADESHFKIIDEKIDKQRALEENPRLGFVKASLWPGGFSRQYSGSTATASRDGGGFFLGAKLDGELWLTREFFAEMGFGYGFWSYGQHDPAQPATDTVNGGASVFTFKVDGGYSYLVTGDFMGPKVFAKLGLRSSTYDLPSSVSDAIGPIAFKSLFLGLGGDLPIRNEWGVDLDFDVGIFNSVTQTGAYTDGDSTSTSSVSFSLGGYYRLNNRMTIRGALEVLAQSADFTNGATISQKVITFSPSLLYYF